MTDHEDCGLFLLILFNSWLKSSFGDFLNFASCIEYTEEQLLAIQLLESFSVKRPNVGSMTILAKLETCAQSCLWSLNECLDAGFSIHDLIPVNFTYLLPTSHTDIVGALFVRLEGDLQDGTKVSCATMVYVSPSAHGFFLPLEAMLDLGLVNPGSPLVQVNSMPRILREHRLHQFMMTL